MKLRVSTGLAIAAIGAFASVIAVSPTFAADLPAKPYYKAPAPEAVFTWTGFYVGAGAGAAHP